MGEVRGNQLPRIVWGFPILRPQDGNPGVANAVLVEEGELMGHPVTIEENERSRASAVRAYLRHLLDAGKLACTPPREDTLDGNRPEAWDAQ